MLQKNVTRSGSAPGVAQDAVQTLERLRQCRERVGREHAAAQASVDTLRKQYTDKMKELKEFGITDPAKIPETLARFETDAAALVRDIDAGIPTEFRSN